MSSFLSQLDACVRDRGDLIGRSRITGTINPETTMSAWMFSWGFDIFYIISRLHRMVSILTSVAAARALEGVGYD